MRRALPVVYSKLSLQTATFHGRGGERGQERVDIALDSEAWFAWLTEEHSFRFTYWKTSGGSVNFTVRPEKRGQRTYWQGWKTIRGQTIKKYIASSATLTKTKLDAVGEWFCQQVEAKTEDRQEMKLYAAVVDLCWLVEQLMEQCPNSTLVAQARSELDRIQRSVGN
jgi:hypothetical protein